MVELYIPFGAEARWCEYAASSERRALLAGGREHFCLKLCPLGLIEHRMQFAALDHASQTLHVQLAWPGCALVPPSGFWSTVTVTP